MLPDGAYLAKYQYTSIEFLLKLVYNPVEVPYSYYKYMKVPETSYNCKAFLEAN